MSSNRNDIVNLSNYEEWFVMYMDNELGAEEKTAVETFILLHPHLQEEMDLLLSTKFLADGVAFAGKESLMADSMKLNAVDESLLLYLDNELPAAGRKALEKKLVADKDAKLQYTVLQQTKLDASEVVPYPNKKELYRHTERVVGFFVWMRVAVAVVLVLLASLFFFTNRIDKPTLPSKEVVNNDKPVKKQTENIQKESPAPAVDNAPDTKLQQQSTAGIRSAKQAKRTSVAKHNLNVEPLQNKEQKQEEVVAKQPGITSPLPSVEIEKKDLSKLTAQPIIALNKPSAISTVTTATPASYYNKETPDVAAATDGEFKIKKGSAKGFLRKVSRFIERRTGIGTVNADNELLVGAVALKLN